MPAVGNSGVNEATRLAAVRFIQTRSVAGHQAVLREIFTTPPTNAGGHELVAAALDTMITTTPNRGSTARFLVLVSTDGSAPSTAAMAERALWALMPESVEAVFTELAKPHADKRLRKLARLQMRLSGSRPPRPIKFWETADAEARRQAVEEWRKAIASRRRP